jgi:epoxyqueuosine reductase
MSHVPKRHSREGGNPTDHATSGTKLDSRLRGSDGVKGGTEPATTELMNGLRSRALAEGLSGCRVTRPKLPAVVGGRLRQFVEKDRHGDMDWMMDRLDKRASPDVLWPEARSAIVLAQPYTPDMDPMERLHEKSSGVISVYALNRDYHNLFKGKLKRLASWLRHQSKAEVKVFVDTAPVMEKPLAAQAGLGWQGKHTNLVSRDLGSWFFIGTILTSLDLPVDDAEVDHCGTCQACLDICPTKAFPAPLQLDARRCISYLTIEHKGHIAREFRKAMGNRIYGCDDCLAVCPWNKFAADAREAKLTARDDLKSPRLFDLLQLDDAGFRRLFSGSAVKRMGRDRFTRNCLIAAGNSGDVALVPHVKALLQDPSELVRAMAVWALRQLTDATSARDAHLAVEKDENVRQEWLS